MRFKRSRRCKERDTIGVAYEVEAESQSAFVGTQPDSLAWEVRDE